MIRKVYQLKAGNLQHLNIFEEPINSPQKEEVQVEVRAIGLNFADVFAIWGLYSATPQGVFTPGLEFSGEVLKIGRDVTKFKTGDKVMGITRFGGYTTHINLDQRYLTPLPDNWSYNEGASFLVQVITAYYGLKYLASISPDQTILIHSAAGGVGLWANRIAKRYNAYTIGTIGNPTKTDLCKSEGYDKIIVRDTKTFTTDLHRALNGKPLNIVMESIGGSILKQSFDALAPMGRMVVFGSSQYAHVSNRPNYLKLIWKYLNRPKIDVQNIINQNKSILAFNLIYLYEQYDLLAQVLKEIDALQLDKPIVGEVFAFEEAKAAITKFQSGKTTGKLLLEVRDI